MRIIVWSLCAFVAVAAAAQQQAADARPDCSQSPLPADCRDTREPFLASAYVGDAVDTFAGDETLKYLNPNDANSARQRAVGGVDFQYRLSGKPGDDHQFWIFGQTVHGVRSKDVDCKNQNAVQLPVCVNNFAPGQDLTTVIGGAPDQFIAILRNASSLEGFFGARYEFRSLQLGTTSVAQLYVRGQLGFLGVSGSGGNVIAQHHLGVGALAVNGIFQQSFLEVGIGKDDLFLRHRNRRLIVDAYLSIDPHYIPLFDVMATKPNSRITPFVQFVGDFDPGTKGSSAIQTYFGLNFNFGYRR